MRLRRAVPTVALALVLAGAAGRVVPGVWGGGGDSAGGPPLGPGEGVVTRVVDGDTLRVRLGDGGADEAVRLIGIDTPETAGRGGLRECFGKEATAHMSGLVPPGTRVRLERDAELRDRYGRLLAYVYRASDGDFVNLRMARDGYADVLTFPPNVAHAERFVEAVAEARAADRGLWRACGNADVRIG